MLFIIHKMTLNHCWKHTLHRLMLTVHWITNGMDGLLALVYAVAAAS